METEKLIKRAMQGDKEALVKLIIDRKQEYYKLAYVYMKNKEDSLDALEDMIVIVYDKFHQLKKEDAFYSWSKTILVNCCNKQLRARKKVIHLDNLEDEAIDGRIEEVEDHMLLEKHLLTLSENHREIIKLRYFLDLDYASISQLLKLPLGTVKSRISIGLKKLKESIGGEGYEKY